ncbi:MAG: hypothetical protein HOM21_00300, partial [Halobacteriovoraceae bacterium]|nr:hypothetical protein [Halobacteriovoraceae bacterium]
MKTGHHARFILLQAIRDFFRQENFTDVLTPPLVENPGMETHIHPMQVSAKNGGQNLGYLHTSPEFHMKELLAAGFDKIFNLSYCFRDEPFSDQHRPQFLMLEWYRGASHYDDIAKDVERLYHFCHQRLLENEVAVLEKKKFTTVTVAELF